MIKTVSLILYACVGALSMSPNPTPADYGRDMAVRAHQSACWYEYLKVFPETKSREFGYCSIQGPTVLRQVKEQELDDQQFADWMTELAMKELPAHYHGCDGFLREPEKEATVDHSDAIHESADHKKYHFRGFVHCVLDEMKKAHGESALTAVKVKLSHKYHWKQILSERENEFRHRHGSEHLKLAKQLSTDAQKWADKIAHDCDPHHSKSDDPDRKFQGEGTGESLAMSTDNTIPVEDTALVAANGWYEEIRDYPFPDGYHGNGTDPLFPKIGHFTQTIWKATRYVGYGYAVNKECPGFKTYMVARYFPAGNSIGHFAENVKPPM